MYPVQSSSLAEPGKNNLGPFYVSIGVVTAIATGGVALRFLARAKSKAQLSYDDYTVLLALIALYFLNVSAVIDAALWGLGEHLLAVIRSGRISTFQKAGLANFCLYWTTCALTKASLLMLYYRIFGISRGFRKAIYVASVIIAGWFVAVTFATIFQCVPAAATWDTSIKHAKCFNERVFSIIAGATGVITDVMILCLPLPMVWNLHTDARQKITLTLVFMLGIFVCVISGVRIIFIVKANCDDPTWVLPQAFMWTSIDASIAILCACLPTLRPLFGHYLSNRSASSGRRSASGRKVPEKSGTSVTSQALSPSKDGFSRLDEESWDGENEVEIRGQTFQMAKMEDTRTSRQRFENYPE